MAFSRTDLSKALSDLGVRAGDTLMVHSSLRKVGPVEGGPSNALAAILDALTPTGTLMAMVSWDQSPYDKTLNGRSLSVEERKSWPLFDPLTARAYPGWGYLNELICRYPQVSRTAHPDASMAAIGKHAKYLTESHPLDSALGPGSPLERLLQLNGKVLLLGAPLDAVTVLHYAEEIAQIPNKREVTYEVPVLGESGEKRWVQVRNLDSNGILDCFAAGGLDAVETIARSYILLNRHAEGPVGNAKCYLFDARDIVDYGVRFLERNFGYGV